MKSFSPKALLANIVHIFYENMIDPRGFLGVSEYESAINSLVDNFSPCCGFGSNDKIAISIKRVLSTSSDTLHEFIARMLGEISDVCPWRISDMT